MIEKSNLDRNEADFLGNKMAVVATCASSNYTYETLYVGRKMNKSRRGANRSKEHFSVKR
jgi:hypothetical protein